MEKRDGFPAAPPGRRRPCRRGRSKAIFRNEGSPRSTVLLFAKLTVPETRPQGQRGLSGKDLDAQTTEGKRRDLLSAPRCWAQSKASAGVCWKNPREPERCNCGRKFPGSPSSWRLCGAPLSTPLGPYVYQAKSVTGDVENTLSRVGRAWLLSSPSTFFYDSSEMIYSSPQFEFYFCSFYLLERKPVGCPATGWQSHFLGRARPGR